MANKKPTSQQNNPPTQAGKKLQKQRQRILKELEDAQQAQAEALERFHRAEARLQKRTAELQRIAAQLLLVHQQLGEPNGPAPLAVAMPSGERAHTQDEPSVDQPIEGASAELAVGAPLAGALSNPSRLSPIDRSTEQQIDASTQDDELPAAAQHAGEPSQHAQAAPPSAEPDEELPIASEHAVQISEIPPVVESTDTGPASPEPISPTQAEEFVREARAVAEAAEQAARQAAERAAEVAAHLEQAGSGARHLQHELQQLQAEAEHADTIAQAARRTAQEAEARAQQLTTEGADDVSGTQWNPPDPPTVGMNDQTPAIGADPGTGETQFNTPVTGEDDPPGAPSTATMIADVAAAAAAEAEAIAEASSARTREARRLAHQADQVLEDARAAMISGIWSGEEAEQYLQTLEREATRAHASLADAESTEEQARRAASNAEVEAEAAEEQVEQNDNL